MAGGVCDMRLFRAGGSSKFNQLDVPLHLFLSSSSFVTREKIIWTYLSFFQLKHVVFPPKPNSSCAFECGSIRTIFSPREALCSLIRYWLNDSVFCSPSYWPGSKACPGHRTLHEDVSFPRRIYKMFGKVQRLCVHSELMDHIIKTFALV